MPRFSCIHDGTPGISNLSQAGGTCCRGCIGGSGPAGPGGTPHFGLLAAGNELRDGSLRVSAAPVLAAILQLACFRPGCRVARRLLTALAATLELLASSHETAAGLASAGERIADVLEHAATTHGPITAAPSPDARRRSLPRPRCGRWPSPRSALRCGRASGRGRAMLHSFADTHPGDPVAAVLGGPSCRRQGAAIDA